LYTFAGWFFIFFRDQVFCGLCFFQNLKYLTGNVPKFQSMIVCRIFWLLLMLVAGRKMANAIKCLCGKGQVLAREEERA